MREREEGKIKKEGTEMRDGGKASESEEGRN